MSSKHAESRRRDRSRSRSYDRERDRRSRSRDRRPRSRTPTKESKSRQRSMKRERKTSGEKNKSSSRDRNESRYIRYRSHSRESKISKDIRTRSLSKENVLSIDRQKSNSRENIKLKENYQLQSKESESKSKAKKSKKKKRHSSLSSSSSSGSSSSSSEEELKLLQRLEAERQRLKEEKRKRKEAMKANETPEEKRARRVSEKQEKERRRRERMGWDGEYQCYTNQDNPFGDSALTHSFVWTKKLAKEGVKNVTREELDAQNRAKQLENKVELEKVKQRRLEREAERAARELESGAAARAREAAQFSSWARQEDAFHLQQARLRSQIRIRDGRAKPIDLLAWYVSSEECVDALEMHEPYSYLHGLQARDLDDLKEDIEVYKELETNDANLSYWEDVQTIVNDEMNKLRGLNAPRSQVHQAVADDVTQIFKGKTGVQLEALQQQIETKISGRQDGIDIGYWENLLSQLKAHMARARLRDRHQQNLRRKLELLKQEQGVTKLEESADADAADSRPSPPASPAPDSEQPPTSEPDAETEAACVALYLAGRYSPAPLAHDALEPATILIGVVDDEERISYLRGRLQAGREAADMPAPTAGSSGTAAPAGVAVFEREARRAMGADEAQFSVEAPLEPPPTLDAPLADKYRPRKPRYFNRVHTGFEWNKYNQTHYDMDNPPPKIVQGYKFNIFYPDLIDKSATPEFSLKPCADNAEFAVLRFHAGPPYEDIAFKIVNREWEYSYKRGFRCHFHNNIFQLWFHFKRYRYRR